MRETISAAKARIVGVLQETAAAYLNPHTFKPGDLVQLREILSASDKGEDDLTPGIVLAVFADLGELTDEIEEKGVVGLRVARAFAKDPTPEIAHAPAWWFEPYRGPRPDAH